MAGLDALGDAVLEAAEDLVGLVLVDAAGFDGGGDAFARMFDDRSDDVAGPVAGDVGDRFTRLQLLDEVSGVDAEGVGNNAHALHGALALHATHALHGAHAFVAGLGVFGGVPGDAGQDLVGLGLVDAAGFDGGGDALAGPLDHRGGLLGGLGGAVIVV